MSQLFFIQNNINLEGAELLIQNAIQSANTKNLKISICVVDAGVNLVAFARMDGASIHSQYTSRKKADTAASTKKPTGWMDQELSLQMPLATNGILTNLPGGAPIIINGQTIGGLGIAGGTIDQDKEISQEAILKYLIDN